MTTTKCNSCGHEIEYGEHPFCPHGYAIGREPRQFQPIIVHRRLNEDGSYSYSYPGNSSDEPSPGYEKVELSTISQVDRFVKDRDAEEMELRRSQISAEREHWDARAKERREMITRELESRLGKSNSQVFDLVKRYVDAKREMRYRQLLSRGTSFHSEIMSFDKHNRKEFIDDSKKKISVHVNRS